MDDVILTLTLNPALDITVTTETLQPHRKLRCSAPRYDAGGGGANVSRVINELGGKSTAFVAAGGPTGERYLELLRAEGVAAVVHAADGDTRFSLTVMEAATGEHYRFVLPGPRQSDSQDRAMLGAIAHACAGATRLIVASGSLPPGIAEDFYGQVAQHARQVGARLILDTSGVALRAALNDRPYCIRINHHEAGELIGARQPVDVAGARQIVRDMVDSGSVEVAIITVAEEGAVVATRDGVLEVRPPSVRVVSTVGAGDSFVGAFTLGLAREWPLERALRFGVAAAAAAVTTKATELCRRQDTERAFDELERLATSTV